MRYRSSLLLTLLGLLGVGSAAAQTRIITGRVTDSLSTDPLTAGQVSVQGTTIGTSIKDDGTFTLAVPTRDVTLAVRSIGFKRRDISVPTSQNSVQVALARDYFQLEAIVVTGQATGVERKNLANAVSTVQADQLVKAPTASVEQSLQGKLAGANISDNSGAPGGGVLVRLRGVTSIIGSFTPLYVVDGVIVSDAAVFGGTNLLRLAFRSAGIAGNQDNPVNRIADLNPSDIDNVQVLKGASASAIYGSKASNGVILITTKRGRVGAPQFTLTQRVGVSHVIPRALIGSRIFNSAADATAVFGSVAAADFTAAGGNTFDNERFLVGNTPLSYESGGSLSGGTETTRYFASALVKHDGGIVHNTFANKQSLRLNLDQSVSSRLNLSVSSEVVHTTADRGLTNNENNGSAWYSSLSVTPSFFDLRGTCGGVRTTDTRCPDGTMPVYPNSKRYASSNPLQSAALFQNRELVWRSLFTGRAAFDAVSTLRHTLRLIANGGGDIFTQKNDVFSPPELQFEPDDGLLGTAVLSLSQNQNFNLNGNAVYTYKTGGGTSATTQAGVQFETRNLNIDRTMSRNLVGGIHNLRAGTTNIVEQDKSLVKDLGFFAQEELLTLNERLLLTVGARADQSSNNGDPSKLFYYPKGSASYRLPVSPGVIDELKLRAAFGYSGNQPKFGQKFTELSSGNIAGLATAVIAGVTGAPDIKPERQREIEGGFDATLFNSRGNLEVTVYEKRVSDLLLTRTLAPTTGFATQFFNGGELRTRGLELALDVLPVRGSSFQWNARGTFFLSRCKVLSLPVPAFRPISFLNSTTFGSTRISPDTSCTRLVGNDTTPQGTRVQFVPLTRPDGGLLDANPDYRFSISNDVTYKRFKLYFLWDRQKGGVLLNATGLLYDLTGTSPDQTTTTPQANCPNRTLCGGWKTVEINGKKLNGDDRAAAFNKGRTELFLEDVSYWKLREVTLTLDLPPSFIRSFWSGARYVRLVASGRNLLTYTPFRGADPENNEIQRSAAEGVPWEIWAYPPSRSVWFSVDLGF